MGNGKWEMRNGKWEMGKWEKWEMGIWDGGGGIFLAKKIYGCSPSYLSKEPFIHETTFWLRICFYILYI
jgi:hypothetical protein